MTYLDFAIIYLSLGAPLGVYSFLQIQNPSIRPIDVFRAVVSVALWPAFGLGLFYSSFRSVVASSGFAHDDRTDSAAFTNTQNVLARLKTSLTVFPRAKAAENYSVVERYVELGLMLQATNAQDTPKFQDLLAAAGHPNARIGAKCLKRRNQQNVLKHHRSARAEVVELVKGLSIDREDVRTIIFDLGDSLDLNLTPFAVRSAVSKGEKWKTIEVPSLENAMNTKS